jgi:hypothetical protein
VRWPTLFRPRPTRSASVAPTWPARPEEETRAEGVSPAAAPEPRPAATQAVKHVPPRRLGRSAPARQERTPVRWNIWSLERVAREHPDVEELSYLVLSLREFADSAGQLPADFDSLVRESFGDLLAG